MKILSVKKNETNFEFEIELDQKEWTNDFNKTQAKIGKNAQMQGFRKGHVPAHILDQMYPAERVALETLNDIQNKTISQVMNEKEFKDIDCLDSVSKLDIVKLAGKNAPTIKIAFDAIPTVTGFDSKDVKNIEIPPFEPRKVPEDVVKFQAKQMISRDAMIEVKKDGIIAKRDIAIIDFEGFKDGKPFAGGKAKDYQLEIGSKSFVDNFEDQLIGLKKGDNKDVHVTFPKDYQMSDLANAKVEFKVVVKEVKKIEYPELDKEYLAKLGIKNGTGMTAVEDHIKDLFKREDEQHYNDNALKIIQEEISKKAKLNFYPTSLLDMHKNQVRKLYEDEAKKNGYKTLDAYKKALNLTEDGFNSIIDNAAKTSLNIAMACEKLIEEYKIEVEQSDRDQFIEKLTLYFGNNKEQANKAMEANKDYFEQLMLKDKLTKKLVIEAKKVAPKKEEKKPADSKKEETKK